MKEKNKYLLFQIVYPIIVTLLCGGILLLISIKPYETIKTYLHIAFMDNSSIVPQSNGIAGLNIVNSDINTNYTDETYESGKVIIPSYGSQYGIIECQEIDMYAPVYWGGGSEMLEKGACHTPASVAVGEKGNSVISAHVNTFFNNLSNISPGDTVTIYTNYGKFTYEVAELISFSDDDEKYIKVTQDNRLTLYTCNIELLGTSSQRIGAICKLTKSEFYYKEDGE